MQRFSTTYVARKNSNGYVINNEEKAKLKDKAIEACVSFANGGEDVMPLYLAEIINEYLLSNIPFNKSKDLADVDELRYICAHLLGTCVLGHLHGDNAKMEKVDKALGCIAKVEEYIKRCVLETANERLLEIRVTETEARLFLAWKPDGTDPLLHYLFKDYATLLWDLTNNECDWGGSCEWQIVAFDGKKLEVNFKFFSKGED